MRFLEWLQLTGKILHGNSYLWSMMKKSSVSRMQRFTYFQILCYVLKRWIRTQHQFLLGKKNWVGSQIHHETELWTQLTESRWNSSGIFSQDSPHCSSSTKSTSSWSKLAIHNILKDELSSCRCSMTSYGDLKTTNRNAMLTPHLCLYLQEDSHQDVGHSSDLDQQRSGLLFFFWQTTRRMGQSRRIDDDQIRRMRTPSFPNHESIVQRNAQKQRRWKFINTLLCRWRKRLKLFSQNCFVNQLSIHGAVSDLWDEYRACQARTGRPVLAGQSDPLFDSASLLMTTPTPSAEVLAQEVLLQKHNERVQRISQQNRVIKFCIDAGFLTTVEVGQYFMTKDTEEFSQFTEPVTFREYTLPRDEKSFDPKGWIRGNTKIGPVFEVTASCLQGKHGVEIRIESVNKDSSHSWVRISHGLNTDLIDK